MKTINLTLLTLFIALGSFAQYKKAGYFGKEGRFYGLGTQFYSLGNGMGTPMGYTLTIGRDVDGKQWFSQYEFQYIFSYSFQFGTTDYNGNPVTTMGKTKGTFIYGVNAGYYLLKNENTQRKIKPYLIGGLSFKFAGGIKENTGEDNDAKIVPSPQFGIGLGGGAGIVFSLTSWLGLQLEGGYTFQYGIAASAEDGGQDVYYTLPSHAYASAGF